MSPIPYAWRIITNLQPLQMEEALAEGVLQEVVVPDLDEVDEHGALALALVRYQHSGAKGFSSLLSQCMM